MQVYIINGPGGSGKDTFVNYIIKKFPEKKIYNFSTIDAIKDILYSFGWNGEKNEITRETLSTLKSIIKNWSENIFHINFEINMIENLFKNKSYPDILFIHCREPEAIAAIKKRYNAKTILVVREGIQEFHNKSDKEVYNFNYDLIINNSFNNLVEYYNYIDNIIEKGVLF